MVKNCILLTICLLIGTMVNVQAQDEMDGIAVYRVYRIYTGATTKADAFFIAHTTEATVVKDGRKYCVYELSKTPSDYTGIQRTFLYRCDGKKIYRYDETLQEDVLMFDFSLNAGDVFTTPQGTKKEIIDVGDCKEYPSLSNYTGRKLRLRDCGNATEEIWIEGIGSMHTGILPQEIFPNAEACVLDMCHMGEWAAVFPQNTPNYKSTTWTPFDIFQDEQPANTNYAFSGDTLVISGRAELNCYPVVTSCFIQNNVIDLDDYTVLFYGEDIFDCLYMKGFEIRIPGFLSGEYTIMAGGQKRTTITCTATSINSVHEIITSSNKSSYDLTGRPLSTPPSRGMYIQNGKKVIK